MLTGTRESARDPDQDADAVAGEAAEEMRIGGNRPGQRQCIGGGGRDHAERVGAGLEQQLRGGVEQYAGQDQGEAGGGHWRLTMTRRGSRASIRIGKPSRAKRS